MTKAIGHGTRNLALNFVEEELQIIRREAFRQGMSMKEFIIRRFRRGLALTDPETAKRLARIKRDRLKATAMLSLLVLHVALIGGELRRPSRGLRARRNEIEEAA